MKIKCYDVMVLVNISIYYIENLYIFKITLSVFNLDFDFTTLLCYNIFRMIYVR